jgi:hypothetical protein
MKKTNRQKLIDFERDRDTMQGWIDFHKASCEREQAKSFFWKWCAFVGWGAFGILLGIYMR